MRERDYAVKNFEDLSAARSLAKFLDGPMGRLYFDPAESWTDRVLVRHFDPALGVDLVAAYGDLVRAVADWVETQPDVSRWARVETPVEVGADYLIRRNHLYDYSTASYQSTDGPPSPAELGEMKEAVRVALANDEMTDRRAQVIARVVARSLLEPTGRTYFNEDEDRFIVVEPKIDRVDVDDWMVVGTPDAGVFRLP